MSADQTYLFRERKCCVEIWGIYSRESSGGFTHPAV